MAEHELTSESVPAASEDMTALRQSLAETIGRLTAKAHRVITPIPALSLGRWEAPTEQTSYMHEPSLCLVAQGAKRVLLGEELYTYDADHYLIASVDLPIVAQVIEASPEKPYLGLMLKLDPRMISQLLVDSKLPMPRVQQTSRGMAVSRVNESMLSAFQRMLALLDVPEDIPILAPLIQKEIVYRLLVGDQGPRLRQLGAIGTQSNTLALAIEWLKENYTRPLRVEDLAGYARMSTSAFHRHFRELTAMSPLQFQKRLRLHEARRMMFAEHLDAASAAFKVGYESNSQFNREYSRLFGAPPLRDIKGLRWQTADPRLLSATAESITARDV
ncbi:AraC family transcriptional regulator [Nitratidesulfovibrio sp.]|uniref:AraC family transcriptional regulator n=1 Tax=Nitratidesulfovibrio sp. TaxID=2802297 RepID=UPI00333EC94E